MSNTMTAHEPTTTIHYLDSILNEEEKRCEYGHQWRNFTISRSGRFKSKNKKRDVVDGKLFDAVSTSTSISTTSATSTQSKEGMINNNRMAGKQEWQTSYQHTTSSKPKHLNQLSTSGIGPSNSHHGKAETYRSFYETNL